MVSLIGQATITPWNLFQWRIEGDSHCHMMCTQKSSDCVKNIWHVTKWCQGMIHCVEHWWWELWMPVQLQKTDWTTKQMWATIGVSVSVHCSLHCLENDDLPLTMPDCFVGRNFCCKAHKKKMCDCTVCWAFALSENVMASMQLLNLSSFQFLTDQPKVTNSSSDEMLKNVDSETSSKQMCTQTKEMLPAWHVHCLQVQKLSLAQISNSLDASLCSFPHLSCWQLPSSNPPWTRTVGWGPQQQIIAFAERNNRFPSDHFKPLTE